MNQVIENIAISQSQDPLRLLIEEDDQGVNADGGTDRKLRQAENRQDDGENARPRLVLTRRIPSPRDRRVPPSSMLHHT